MKIQEDHIQDLLDKLREILEELEFQVEKNSKRITQVALSQVKSAVNLVHYSALRKFDLRILQKNLKHLGLSRLAHAHGHVLCSLLLTHRLLAGLLGKKMTGSLKSGLSIKNSKLLHEHNTKSLLGAGSSHRRVQIMVTLPSQAAQDKSIVASMIDNGMNCARVNCAHDAPQTWIKMIEHVREVASSQGTDVKIAMDLGGPKIRTGAIQAGPKVRKFTPERDPEGHVINPAYFWLRADSDDATDERFIPVDKDFLATLSEGDALVLLDTREKKRVLRVNKLEQDGVSVLCFDTTYIGTGTSIWKKSAPETFTVVGELPPIAQALLLKPNDVLVVHKQDQEGEPAQYDDQGYVVRPAHISCTLKEIFSAVRLGDPILFDDGKIEGIITEVGEEAFSVRITRAKPGGTKLKSEKGINLPKTFLGISGLTEKDKVDLQFVAKHADIVNYSFVNQPSDVEDLLASLQKAGSHENLGIVLKIETSYAYNDLKNILLTALRWPKVGVMIARGDLAVETGWDNIGKVQNEILAMCSAAHIPVIWATQVLENLAKKGLPSRSEITDVTSALNADCVMLNKGPYINSCISLLDKILTDMDEYQEKNETLLPQLERLG